MFKQILRVVWTYTDTETYSWNSVHWANSSGFPQTLLASAWASPRSPSLFQVIEGSWMSGLGLTRIHMEKRYICSTILKLCFTIVAHRNTYRIHLFREGTVVSLGNVFPHRVSHRLDFFAQRDTRRWWRLNAVSRVPVGTFDLIYKQREAAKDK